MNHKLHEPCRSKKRSRFCFILSLVVLIFGVCEYSFAQKPNAKLPAAEKIVDNYVKAIGGKKRLASIRDATYEWTIQLNDQTLGLGKTQLKAPASMRLEMRFGNGQIISAANGRSAWARGLDGDLRTLTGPEAAAAKIQSILAAANFIDFKKSNIFARTVALSDSPSGAVYAVEFSTRSGGKVRYFFSAGTKLLDSVQDDARKTTIRFADYKTEDGVLVPHLMTLQTETGPLTLKLLKVTFNANVADAVFDPPQGAESLDVAALLREVSKNQDEVEKRFTGYSLVQKETEREMDSKGQIKKETVKVYEVFPIANRESIMKLISENGVVLSAERAAKEEKRVQEEFEKAERDKEKDAARVEKAKAERARKQKEKGKDENEDLELSQFLKVCEFVSPRREKFRDREAVVFDFRARPGFKPSNREETLIAKLVGVVWIDPVDKQVMRLEARLAEGFKMGGGLVLSLKPGAAFVMEQTRMNEGVWLPRFMQLNLSVKILIFGGGDMNQTIEWSDYRHFSTDVGGYKLDAPKLTEEKKKP
jgi:hypothetical protein